MLDNQKISRRIILGFLILGLLALTVGIGFEYQEDNDTRKSSSDEEPVQTISTGSMPADTLEERAEMRKMTATVYNHSD